LIAARKRSRLQMHVLKIKKSASMICGFVVVRGMFHWARNI
jgi:hypothetical protein